MNRVWIVRRENATLQCDLASQVGISESYLSRIERGRVRPSDELKQRIAGALGLSAKELWPGETRNRHQI